MEAIKYPNPNNSGMGQAFCKKSNCQYFGHCIFAFNSVIGGRELRLDFNLCNLNCILCWSDNNAPSMMVDADSLFSAFKFCINRKNAYLRSQYPAGVKDSTAFNTSCIQIIGGEPFLSRERFRFILNFLRSINQYVRESKEASNYLNFNRKKQFKVKIFTNGICIGQDVITHTDLLELNELENIDVRLLLSLKGLNQKATCQLQSEQSDKLLFLQVNALENLLQLPLKSITIEPVLGFYHSSDFNIKTPEIAAKNMFVFNADDAVSLKLHQLLKKHIAKKGKIYVEPVHSVPQSNKGREKFYHEFELFLERDCLIEPKLKGGSRKNIKDTILTETI